MVPEPYFIPGGIYRLRDNGLCQYVGPDEYRGQVTLEFRRLDYGGERTYLLPDVALKLAGAE